VDVTPTIARALGLSEPRGALVVGVEAGSGAAQAGVRVGHGERIVDGVSIRPGGDVIVAIGSRPVANGEDIARIAAEQLRPGQTVRLTVLRDGRQVVLAVRLGARKS
jgi:serine protease Do